jgi:calcium-dependent protein kinase
MLLRQIIAAIEYCHSLDPPICHRDLKPENFLFKTGDDNAPIKIIDFGLSKYEEPGEKLHTRVGTPYYIAPEVLRRNYTIACDMWSIGVIAYILLCGYPPFHGDNDRDIFRRIQQGAFNFPMPEWGPISKEAKAFITALLQHDAAARMTASVALVDPWIVNAVKARL